MWPQVLFYHLWVKFDLFGVTPIHVIIDNLKNKKCPPPPPPKKNPSSFDCKYGQFYSCEL